MKTNKNNLIIILFLSISMITHAYLIKNNVSIPFRIELIKKQSDFSGLYVLKSCENGRFKLKIDKKNASYLYFILDGKKIISKGKVNINKEDDIINVIFGKMEGIFKQNEIQIQNYGNSMNEYNHFTQCSEKYLLFIKQ